MKKEMIFIIAGLLLVFCSCCLAEEENTLEAEDYRYTVTAEGAMIEEYTGQSADVAVPSSIDGLPVVGIGKNAFYGKKIDRVVLPDGIVFIGEEAFAESSILEIELPDSLLSIGDGAFADSLLIGINMPDSVTSLGIGALAGCSELADVKLSQSLQVLPEACFKEDVSLSSIILPDGITTIQDGCFYYCIQLKSISLPDSLRIIGYESFCECPNLHEVSLPDGLIRIGESCFYRCSELEKINIPDSVIIDEFWNEYMFLHCDKLTLHIHDNTDAKEFAEKYGIRYILC